jgi:hypothetical protein
MFKNTKKHIDITFGDVIHLPSTEITNCKYFKRNSIETSVVVVAEIIENNVLTLRGK